MSFNTARRNKNRNLNNSNNPSNYGPSSKIDKQNSRMKSLNDKSTHHIDGVYLNPDFMYANTSMVGTLANILHKDGNVYEGVFNTFSSHFEIVLDTVAIVVPTAEANPLNPNVGTLLSSLLAKNEFMEQAIFKLDDIVMMNVPNVNLDFAIKGDFTDTEISKFNPSVLTKEKDLVPWEGGAEDDSLDDSLGNDMTLNDECGWDANDMFKMHEKKYNMATTYTDSMDGYTVPLDKNAEDYQVREAEAKRIASLIENDVASKDRLAKEDGDEEDKFSAVVRPVANEQSHQSSPGAYSSHSQTSAMNKPPQMNQNNSSPLINQQPHSRHDNSNSRNRNDRSDRIDRNKNNQNAPGSGLNAGGYFASNSGLNRSKNQASPSLNSVTGTHQQPSPSYHYSSRSNGPMNNRLNSRQDLQQQHNYHPLDQDHNRHERMMHSNDSHQTMQSQRSHNTNNNRRGLNLQPSLPKRDETTSDLKKFSSNFKMAINQNDNKDIVNKDLAKEMKQSNLNKHQSSDSTVSVAVNNNNKEQINNVNKNDQPSSGGASKSSTISMKNEDVINSHKKSVSKPPLIDRLPKEKSSSTEKLNNAGHESQSSLADKNANKQQHQSARSGESLQKSSSVESSTSARRQESIEQSQENTATKESQQQRDNESLEPQTNIENQVSTDSEKNSSANASSDQQTSSTSNTPAPGDKTKKSTLNPMAKEFVFNPKASPYTPKFAPSNAYSPSPMNLANMPAPTAITPQTVPPPQLAYQATAMHGQPPPPPPQMQHAANQPPPQQQLITPVLHPSQQPLMAHHPNTVPMHAHQPSAHQVLTFPAHLMSSQSIQFVQTNPQNLIHQHHQTAHHQHHHQAPYIMSLTNQVSTANLPSAPLNASSNAIAMSYGAQQAGGPPTVLAQPPSAGPRGSGAGAGGSGGAPRNKAGQYHNQSGNPRSNQNSQQSNANQQPPPPQMQANPMTSPYIMSAVSPAQVSASNLPPNAQLTYVPMQHHQGPHQMLQFPQMMPIHQHQMHLPPNQQQPFVTGSNTNPVGDPAFQMYSNYMTNMAGVPHHQFVTLQPPASVSSPIHMNHHGSNTMINNNIGVVSTPAQPQTAGQPRSVATPSNVSTSQAHYAPYIMAPTGNSAGQTTAAAAASGQQQAPSSNPSPGNETSN